MKHFIFIAFVTLLFGCDSENASDCFQTSGTITQQEVVVSFFDKIRFEDDIRLIIKQGDIQQVIIESGENLLNEVSATVIDSILVIKNNNSCNLVRDFGITKAIVTVSNLIEIRNSSGLEVRSEGVLAYPKLRLLSNTLLSVPDGKNSGDFHLTLQTNNLRISANGISVFYLNGEVNKANIIFSDEIPRLEGENLIIQELEVLQRSSNIMIVNPQLSIIGEIRGIGDIISKNRPPIVDVETFFTGQLIFDD